MEAAVRVLLVAEVETPCFGIPFHARNGGGAGGLEWGVGTFC